MGVGWHRAGAIRVMKRPGRESVDAGSTKLGLVGQAVEEGGLPREMGDET